MKKLLFILTLFITNALFSQVDPAYNPDGYQAPRFIADTLTTAQRNNLSIIPGTIIYHKDTGINRLETYNGTSWTELGSTYDDTSIQAEVDLNTAKTSFPGFTSLLNDYSFTDNSTNWNTAFGWGDWSTGVDETFIGGLDLGTIPKFGITGQILVKSSNFNYDVEWQDFSSGGDMLLGTAQTSTETKTFSNSINEPDGAALVALQTGAEGMTIFSESSGDDGVGIVVKNTGLYSRGLLLTHTGTNSRGIDVIGSSTGVNISSYASGGHTGDLYAGYNIGGALTYSVNKEGDVIANSFTGDGSGLTNLPNDFSEFMTSTGTRSGGDLVTTIGDYDDSGNGTQIGIDDSDGSISLKGSTIQISTNGFGANLKTTDLTQFTQVEFPDASGTLALTSDLSTLIDDDTFATATSTNVPSSESVKAYVDANAGSDLLAKSSTITTSRNALITDADGLNVSTSASDVIITILNGTFEVGTVLAYQSNGAGQIFVDDNSGNLGQTYDSRKLIRVWQTATDVWELYDPPVDVSDSIEGVSSLGTTYSDLVLSLGGIGFLDPSITIDHTTNVISLFSPNPINQSFTDITGSLTADSIIKDGATSDDVLLGDGTTTSLSGITAGTISNTWNDLTVDTTLDETTFNGDGFIHYYEAVNDSIAVTIPDDTTLGIASTDDVSYSFFRKGSGKIQTVFASGVEGENVEHVADSTKRVFNLIHKGSNNWIASGDFQYYTPAVATSSNLILNSTFDNATNLTLGSAWSVGSGVASYDDSAISPIEFALSENLQNGVTYDVAIDFTTGGTARINVEINGVTSGWTELQSYWNFSNGSTSFPLTMSEEATAIRFNGNTSHSTFTIDNVTITPQ